jgi:hypothetical protein
VHREQTQQLGARVTGAPHDSNLDHPAVPRIDYRFSAG